MDLLCFVYEKLHMKVIKDSKTLEKNQSLSTAFLLRLLDLNAKQQPLFTYPSTQGLLEVTVCSVPGNRKSGPIIYNEHLSSDNQTLEYTPGL